MTLTSCLKFRVVVTINSVINFLSGLLYLFNNTVFPYGFGLFDWEFSFGLLVGVSLWLVVLRFCYFVIFFSYVLFFVGFWLWLLWVVLASLCLVCFEFRDGLCGGFWVQC